MQQPPLVEEDGSEGHEDGDGYLYLTGRAKNVIVTEGGKNVFPEEIEDHFQLHSEIEQCCVIGFMLGFSWGGFVCIQSGMSTAGSVGVGVLVGLFMFLLIAQLMRFIYGLRSDGSLDYKTLVGMKGTVYVTIPPHGEPGGQVQVAHPSQLVTMQAIQYGDHPLPAQTRIIVTEANTLQLVVRSLDEPAPGPSPQSGDAAPSPDFLKTAARSRGHTSYTRPLNEMI